MSVNVSMFEGFQDGDDTRPRPRGRVSILKPQEETLIFITKKSFFVLVFQLRKKRKALKAFLILLVTYTDSSA